MKISDNGIGVAEVAKGDFDEVGNSMLGDRFACNS